MTLRTVEAVEFPILCCARSPPGACITGECYNYGESFADSHTVVSNHLERHALNHMMEGVGDPDKLDSRESANESLGDSAHW